VKGIKILFGPVNGVKLHRESGNLELVEQDLRVESKSGLTDAVVGNSTHDQQTNQAELQIQHKYFKD
jgi:hypothetical protein